jgi:hypothetical protein
MDIRKNARLTPQGRFLLVRRVDELGWKMAEAAGTSRRQGYRWLTRCRSGSSTALLTALRRPGAASIAFARSAPRRSRGLRGQRMSGPANACQLGMPVSTVGAILRRLGLGKLTAGQAKPAAVGRYERQRPGELIIDALDGGRLACSRASRAQIDYAGRTTPRRAQKKRRRLGIVRVSVQRTPGTG